MEWNILITWNHTGVFNFDDFQHFSLVLDFLKLMVRGFFSNQAVPYLCCPKMISSVVIKNF